MTYAQNILVFARKDYLADNSLLKEEFENTHLSQLSIVHPRKYLELIRIQLRAQDVANLIAKRDRFILVDREQFRELMALGDQAIPFLERSGQYWGPPADSITAIHELERLRQSGFEFHSLLMARILVARLLRGLSPPSGLQFSLRATERSASSVQFGIERCGSREAHFAFGSGLT